MKIWKKTLNLGILLTIFSINGYANPLDVVKPEIENIAFWNGTWHIHYTELKNGTNLLKEELFVDGNSDRIVTVGTEEKRGFSLHGTYATNVCHKAYVVVYDKAHNMVTKSDLFEFGDTTKCSTYVEPSDMVDPVLILKGVNPQFVTKGESYEEFGATALDNRDGDLTKSIVVDDSEVDTSTTGEYTISYDVVDTAGNDVTATRTVKVVDTDFMGELEIHKINFYRGKWYIRYQDLRKVPNVRKEILFVDGDEVRTLTGGYNRPYDRGFSFAGNYAEDACHKAYIVAYDTDDNELSKSKVFKFGDTSTCADATIVPTAPKNVRTNSEHHNPIVNILFEDTSTNEVGFHIYNDEKLIKSIEAHEGQGEIVVSLQEFNSGDIANIVVKAFNNVGESEASNRLLYISNLYIDGYHYLGMPVYSLEPAGNKSGLYLIHVYSGVGSVTSHGVSFFYIKDGKVTNASLDYSNLYLHGTKKETKITALSEERISFDFYDNIDDVDAFKETNHYTSKSTYDISDLSNIFMLSGSRRACTAPMYGYGAYVFTLVTYEVWSINLQDWITVYDKATEDKGYACEHQF